MSKGSLSAMIVGGKVDEPPVLLNQNSGGVSLSPRNVATNESGFDTQTYKASKAYLLQNSSSNLRYAEEHNVASQ